MLRPWMTALGATAALLLAGWYLAATLYLVFRDEMLARLLNQQAEMQYAYEDRLAALRNQIDKVTSRQLLDQNSLEGKVQELLSRQAQLETRQAVVASLAEQPIFAGQRPPARTGGRTDGQIGDAVQSFAPADPKPSPAVDAFELRLFAPRAIGGPERRLDQSELRDAPAAIAIATARDVADRLERRQIAALDAMDKTARNNAERLSAAFAETGLDPQRFAAASAKQPQGGPLIPLAGKGAGHFELKLTQVQFTMQQADRMRRIVGALPLSRPMPADFETTSGFGARSDPFTRGMAMHTGIDFRAPSGSSVRATAAGKVVEAAYVGGYGNMVEIDHGAGVTTRYAHLSVIAVDVGDSVAKGDILGRVGSTGRSTGPHLHYETRIDGEAADPMRFMRAGRKVGNL